MPRTPNNLQTTEIYQKVCGSSSFHNFGDTDQPTIKWYESISVMRYIYQDSPWRGTRVKHCPWNGVISPYFAVQGGHFPIYSIVNRTTTLSNLVSLLSLQNVSLFPQVLARALITELCFVLLQHIHSQNVRVGLWAIADKRNERNEDRLHQECLWQIPCCQQQLLTKEFSVECFGLLNVSGCQCLSALQKSLQACPSFSQWSQKPPLPHPHTEKRKI